MRFQFLHELVVLFCDPLMDCHCYGKCSTHTTHQSVVGVVYNFALDQLFAAKKGAGATMNEDPIHVSQCTGTGVKMVE